MFYVEHDIQPEVLSNTANSFWCAIATLSNVGYGDVYPITGVGRLISGIIALLGIGLVALPTGIIGSRSMKEIQKKQRKSPIIQKLTILMAERK
jgi:voltage-gated potassium channel